MLLIPKKINRKSSVYYIQSEKVRGLQLNFHALDKTLIISNRKKSEACNIDQYRVGVIRIISNRKKSEACNAKIFSWKRFAIISNRKKSEACNFATSAIDVGELYPIGKSQRPATTLRVNELDAHQSSFSAFLPS